MTSRFKENNIWVNEKQSVFLITNAVYTLLCLYIAAYFTPKEKTVVLTHWYE